MYSSLDHTFVLSAYKESPYLGQCLASLLCQSVKTSILVATATPNEHIEKACIEYGVPLYVNAEEPGISSDWNFAMSCASTQLVTIAHQDDIYESDYVARMLEAVNSAERPLLFFTNYGELRNGERVNSNRLLSIKRKILAPLRLSWFARSRFVRRCILSIGTAICCPSVSMVVSNLPHPLFNSELKCSLDWEAWERSSRLEGSFLYDPEILIYHRIHKDSETTNMIEDNTRTQEDLYMFERFWPHYVAVAINRVYSRSQNSNN